MPSSNSKLAESISLGLGGNPVLQFVLPDEIPIDPEATLDQLTNRFRSVRDGLPELIKNAKDQYSRLGVTETEDRQIVIILNTDTRCLAVLDFAGAPAENFEGWTTWSDPSAGKPDLAADIEAGHGNWPAAGFVDTEIRCLTELEIGNAEKEVQPRVQA